MSVLQISGIKMDIYLSMYNIFQKFDLMLYRIASYIQQQPLV